MLTKSFGFFEVSGFLMNWNWLTDGWDGIKIKRDLKSQKNCYVEGSEENWNSIPKDVKRLFWNKMCDLDILLFNQFSGSLHGSKWTVIMFLFELNEYYVTVKSL